MKDIIEVLEATDREKKLEEAKPTDHQAQQRPTAVDPSSG